MGRVGGSTNENRGIRSIAKRLGSGKSDSRAIRDFFDQYALGRLDDAVIVRHNDCGLPQVDPAGSIRRLGRNGAPEDGRQHETRLPGPHDEPFR